MPGIVVISNPNALRSREAPDLAGRMQAILEEEGIVLETPAVDRMADAAAACLSRGPDLVAVNGGDGTLHVVVTELVRAYANAGRKLPPIALLRGGTMNTIAKGMRTLPGTPLAILRRLVEKHRRGLTFETLARHALDLNGGAELGFLFGLGAPVGFLRAYYEGRGRGPAKGALLLGRLVLSALGRGAFARDVFSPVSALLSLDGQRIAPRPWSVIMAATVTEVGLGFAPFRRTLDEEGRFQIIASGDSPMRLASQLHRIHAGDRVRGDAVDALVEEARIEVQGKVDYLIDGEIKPAPRRITLRAGPRLSFVVK
jgi:diacylglycerol kinase family enzyme